MLEITCFYIILHLNLKQLGFTGEPVHQWTRQSHVNVNHIRMLKNLLKHHAMSSWYKIESSHFFFRREEQFIIFIHNF